MKKRKYIKILVAMFVIVLFLTSIGVNGVSNNIQKDNNKFKQSSNQETVTISLEKYDENKNNFIKETIAEISLEEAESIKQQLVEIEKNFQTEEKIRKQMELLQENNLLPGYMNLDDYLIVLDRMKQYFDNEEVQGKLSPGLIFSGPSISSTLALGGQTYKLELLLGDILQYYFDVPLIDIQNDDLFNGTHLHSTAYAGPVYVGFSPSSAFITTIGVLFSGPPIIYSPFISIRVVFAGAHLSAKIFECENPITVFDWHLNVAMLGVVLYQSNVEPSIPQNIQGPKKGYTNKVYSFSTSAADMEGDEIYYKFNWGDNTESQWIGPYENFERVKASHSFSKENNYQIKVKVKDSNDLESDWSDGVSIKITEKKSRQLENNKFWLNRFLNNYPNLNKILIQLF